MVVINNGAIKCMRHFLIDHFRESYCLRER